MADIILASQSPRRQDLLTAMGVKFRVIPSNIDEKLDDSRNPEDVASGLALSKALAVAQNYPDSIVIGSDTIATINSKQLEKPRDAEDATAMLAMLAGKSHDVSTGLAVVSLAAGVKLVGVETTKVYFKPYDPEAIEAYVATGDPLDKAGAYGIQSGAALLVDFIVGNYDTVIGLPTTLLSDYLSQLRVISSPVELKPPVPQK